mmetsp:Transcript_46369/g.88525  ORF Transcript_46369/g.88525 Transcript_46369/m.88525 type:complete len:103 (-) Transcript_46369:1338-1646(-)
MFSFNIVHRYFHQPRDDDQKSHFCSRYPFITSTVGASKIIVDTFCVLSMVGQDVPSDNVGALAGSLMKLPHAWFIVAERRFAYLGNLPALSLSRHTPFSQGL